MEQGQASVVQLMRENWFWTEIFRDHATFLHDNLAPQEERYISWTQSFQQAFDRLLTEARSLAQAAGVTGPAGSAVPTLLGAAGAPEAVPLAGLQGQELLRYEQEAVRVSRAMLETLGSLLALKQQIIQAKLDCQIALGLGPVIVAHMAVEAEEAQRALTGALEANPLPPALQMLHHHLIWLPDAAGHAALLVMQVDGVEQELRQALGAYQQGFDWLQVRGLELYSMLRYAPRPVGALRRLNREAVERITAFRTLLGQLKERVAGCEVLVGGLVPLVPDHMMREALYYTEKVLQTKG